MSDDKSKREIHRESDDQRAERWRYLILSGSPMPLGWSLPPQVEPPAKSEESALRRAADEIASLKSSPFHTSQVEQWGDLIAASRGQDLTWEEIPEEGKQEVLWHWVNWEGVAVKDRAAMAMEHLDIERLEPSTAASLRKAAGLQERPPERHRVSKSSMEFENPNLMPEELAAKIPPLYSQENVSDPIARAKWFTPDSSWSWYATEYDPKERVAFGLVYGHEAELGYFSIEEMQSARGPAGLPIVRDPDFEPCPLSRCDDPCDIHKNPLKPTIKHKR